METAHGQFDFSGGLNLNPRIAENQLQECTNCDLRDFGKIKPELQDTLIKTVADVTSIGTIDGYVYYLVNGALSRIKAGKVDSIGTIGKGTFYALKWEDMHLIIGSDKVYKVLDGSLTVLGTAGPESAPTLAGSTLSETVIDAMEDNTTWSASGTAIADNATDVKVGTNSMKLTPSAANTLGYATKSISADLSIINGNDDDDDLIAFWVYVDLPGEFTYLQIVFDINTGDFKNDLYIKTVPIMTIENSLVVEDVPQTYTDPPKDIGWDNLYTKWSNLFKPNSRREFGSNFFGKMLAQNSIQKKKNKKKTTPDLGQAGWSHIRIRKSEFLRQGVDSTKDWANVAAVKLVVMANTASCGISFDDLKLMGGGKLNAETYAVSYSYVSKYSFDDDSEYIEESQLSPESELEVDERQNIIITGITDSDDSQVTHKRIYIRGGGLTLRHQAGEIATGTTTFTTDKSEPDLVVESAEDCRKNGVASTDVIYATILSGRLFLLKGRTLSWSRSLIPSAFESDANVRFPFDLTGAYPKGSNIAVLGKTDEVIYVNPGYGATEGGYNHYAENPQGCIATRSAIKGFHLAEEGLVYFTAQNPEIISDKIRSELLGYTSAERQAAIGTFLRGSYYLCIPGQSVVYELETRQGRFIKYDTIKDIVAGDDGIIYALKTDGIYSFQTDTTKRKSFAFRTQDIIMPDDRQFRNIVFDADFGSDAVTVEYYINGVAKTSRTFTTSGRERKYLPITQQSGYRISVRFSRATETSYTDTAIYGVWLQ